MVGWLQSKQRPWFNQLKQEDVRGGAGEVAATIFSPTATCQKTSRQRQAFNFDNFKITTSKIST